MRIRTKVLTLVVGLLLIPQLSFAAGTATLSAVNILGATEQWITITTSATNAIPTGVGIESATFSTSGIFGPGTIRAQLVNSTTPTWSWNSGGGPLKSAIAGVDTTETSIRIMLYGSMSIACSTPQFQPVAMITNYGVTEIPNEKYTAFFVRVSTIASAADTLGYDIILYLRQEGPEYIYRLNRD